MKVFLYKIDGLIAVGYPCEDDVETAAKKAVPKGQGFWIVDQSLLPATPQESWIIEDVDYDGTGERE